MKPNHHPSLSAPDFAKKLEKLFKEADTFYSEEYRRWRDPALRSQISIFQWLFDDAMEASLNPKP